MSCVSSITDDNIVECLQVNEGDFNDCGRILPVRYIFFSTAEVSGTPFPFIYVFLLPIYSSLLATVVLEYVSGFTSIALLLKSMELSS